MPSPRERYNSDAVNSKAALDACLTVMRYLASWYLVACCACRCVGFEFKGRSIAAIDAVFAKRRLPAKASVKV